MRNIAASIHLKLIGCTLDPFKYDHCYTGLPLDDLTHVSDDEVRKILTEMPAKSSPMDFIPSSMLKSCSPVFTPIIARLANLSFKDGFFPYHIQVCPNKASFEEGRIR